MTNAMKLISELTHFFKRKESHFTVDGVRALVEFEGYLYQVDVKPLMKIEPTEPEVHPEIYVAPDGSC